MPRQPTRDNTFTRDPPSPPLSPPNAAVRVVTSVSCCGIVNASSFRRVHGEQQEAALIEQNSTAAAGPRDGSASGSLTNNETRRHVPLGLFDMKLPVAMARDIPIGNVSAICCSHRWYKYLFPARELATRGTSEQNAVEEQA